MAHYKTPPPPLFSKAPEGWKWLGKDLEAREKDGGLKSIFLVHSVREHVGTIIAFLYKTEKKYTEDEQKTDLTM